ncbi:MAG TPA: hypothetical protein VIN59_09290 [Alphaproteobacteria bacterium]
MELLAVFQRYLGMDPKTFNHNPNPKDSPVLAGLSEEEKEAAIQNYKRGLHSATPQGQGGKNDQRKGNSGTV